MWYAACKFALHMGKMQLDCEKIEFSCGEAFLPSVLHLPVVLSIVLVASGILQFTPALPVTTGSHHYHIPGIMQMK